MKINLTFNLSDDQRAAIANRLGQKGKASYRTCRGFISSLVTADMEFVTYEEGLRDAESDENE